MNYSKQRELVLQAVLENPIHPTADGVYQQVRQQNPRISLGTVYRNLALLASLGEIIKITVDGADRFDAHVEPHSHFICKNCHQVLDLHVENEELIQAQAQKNFPGQIEGHVVQYFGLCSTCLKEQQVLSQHAEAL